MKWWYIAIEFGFENTLFQDWHTGRLSPPPPAPTVLGWSNLFFFFDDGDDGLPALLVLNLPQLVGAPDVVGEARYDQQIHQHQDEEQTQRRYEGRLRGQRRRDHVPPVAHVDHHGGELAVSGHHAADVEDLVRVADDVEPARGQDLREVRRVEEPGDEGHVELAFVRREGLRVALRPAAEGDPVQEGNAAAEVGEHEGEHPEELTEPPLLHQSWAAGEYGAATGVGKRQRYESPVPPGTQVVRREYVMAVD